jgi:hypothetical protein
MENETVIEVIPDRQPIIAHALLVEVFSNGEMRVRMDAAFIADRRCETLRPLTGIEPVSREVGLDQAAQAAVEFVGMLRSVYPG